MSFRSKLNDYIQKNELPEWLEADKLTELLPEQSRAVVQSAPKPQSEEKAPVPAAQTAQAVQTAPPATPAAPAESEAVHEKAPAAEEKQPERIAHKAEVPSEINAKTFIDIARAEKLTGGEFLELLGNSRLSNSAYKEIELNPEITLERIVEILEASQLKRDDYIKLIAAINTIVKNRRKAELRAERNMTGDTMQLPKSDEMKHFNPSDTVSIDIPAEKAAPKPASKEVITENTASSAYERVTFVEAPPKAQPEFKPDDEIKPTNEIKRVSSVELQQSAEVQPTAEKRADGVKPADAAIISDFASLIDDGAPDESISSEVTANENELTEIIPEHTVNTASQPSSTEKQYERHEFSVADIAAEPTMAMPDFSDELGFSANDNKPDDDSEFGFSDITAESDNGSADNLGFDISSEKPANDNDFDFSEISAKPDNSADNLGFDISSEKPANDSDFDFSDISAKPDNSTADNLGFDISSEKPANDSDFDFSDISAKPDNSTADNLGFDISSEKPANDSDFDFSEISAKPDNSTADNLGFDISSEKPANDNDFNFSEISARSDNSADNLGFDISSEKPANDSDFDFSDISAKPDNSTADNLGFDISSEKPANDNDFGFSEISAKPDNSDKNGYTISGIAVKPVTNTIKSTRTEKIQADDENGYYIPNLSLGIKSDDKDEKIAVKEVPAADDILLTQADADDIPDLSTELSIKKEPKTAAVAVGEHHVPKSSLQKSIEAITAEKKAAELNQYAATNEPEEHLPKTAQKPVGDDMLFSPDFFSIDDDQSAEDNSGEELLISPDDDFFGEKIAPQKSLSVTTILSDLPTSAAKMPVDASVTTILSGMTEAIAEAEKPQSAELAKPSAAISDSGSSVEEAPKKKPKNMIDLPEAPAEKPAADGYKGSEYFEEVKPVKRGGKGKKAVIAIIVLLLLLGGAAGASYYFTGSFIPFIELNGQPSAGDAESTAITDYAQLAALISAKPAADDIPQYTQYSTESRPYTALLGSIAAVGDRVYYADGNAVTQFTAVGGKPTFVARNELECTKLLGIAALNSQLCIVYEQDGATAVAIYGADFSHAQYTYTQDGSFTDITYTNERLCLTTAYTAPEAATAENAAPSYSVNEAKTMVDCANIYAPSAPESRSFTVIGSVSESPLVFAVAGGRSSFAKIDDNGICAVANYANGAVVRKFDISEHTVSVSAETFVAGNIPAPCFIDERGGKTRLLCTTANGAVLGVYSSALTLDAQADKIAVGESITGVSFNGSLVTVLTNGVMRCFNTDGGSIKTLDAATCEPYTQKLLRFGDNLVGLEVITDGKGARNGLRLVMYSYDNGLSAVSEKIISIIGSDGTNYNEYLNSDVESSPSALAVSEDMKTIVVPIIYFDGVSKVEKFVTYKYNVSDGFMQAGEFTLYDENSSFRASIISGAYIYVVVDDTVTGISVDGGKIIATVDMK